MWVLNNQKRRHFASLTRDQTKGKRWTSFERCKVNTNRIDSCCVPSPRHSNHAVNSTALLQNYSITRTRIYGSEQKYSRLLPTEFGRVLCNKKRREPFCKNIWSGIVTRHENRSGTTTRGPCQARELDAWGLRA